MRAVLAFLRRHKWSLPLAVGATIFFVRLAGETSEGELDPFDAAIAQRVGSWRGPLDSVMLGLTDLGGPIGMSIVAAGLAAVLVARRRWKELRYAAVSAGGALLLNIALKPFFHRARPGAALEYILSPPTSFSFPSGHAMGSTGVLATAAVVVAVVGMRRRWRVVAFIVAGVVVVGIALSRVYFGVHFPSDVLGGILAGSAWVSAVTGWFYPRLLPGETKSA
jgi:membrane-associated phospholipid phosphatase